MFVLAVQGRPRINFAVHFGFLSIFVVGLPLLLHSSIASTIWSKKWFYCLCLLQSLRCPLFRTVYFKFRNILLAAKCFKVNVVDVVDQKRRLRIRRCHRPVGAAQPVALCSTSRGIRFSPLINTPTSVTVPKDFAVSEIHICDRSTLLVKRFRLCVQIDVVNL